MSSLLWLHKLDDLACEIAETLLPDIPSKGAHKDRHAYDCAYDTLYGFMVVLGKLDLVDYEK